MVDRAGLAGSDGDTHQGLLDISWGRAIPNLEIYTPCDEVSLRDAMLKAAKHEGPTLIRYPRGLIPAQKLSPTIADGGIVKIKDGSLWAMLGNGPAVSVMRDARTLAAQEGLCVPAVYDVRRVKPLDVEVLDDILTRYNLLAVLEENYMPGGLGEAVAARIAEKAAGIRLVRFGVPDVCVKHATQSQQREMYGLTPENVIAQCKNYLPHNER